MLYIILICILQPVITIHKGSGCGCNLNRAEGKNLAKDDSIRSSYNYVDECPIGHDDDKEYSIINEIIGADTMILVPADEYQVGTDDIAIESDQEGPKRIVKLESFYVDKYEVSNKDFADFISKTNYKTEAEQFGDSFVFSEFLNSTFKEQLKDFRAVQAVWWYKVYGTDWSHPYGPDSDISKLMDHPVTHVSWNDAQAYCKWRGARLPTEAEWEGACRGGHRDTKYPWGDKLFPGRKHMANIWQGTFPTHNSAKDGYIGTCPVDMFPPNDFGLYNMAGNVWEWTEDSWAGNNLKEKVKKGGSYLCHLSYCYRYRCSSRSHNTEDSSAGNLGFRCAKSAKRGVSADACVSELKFVFHEIAPSRNSVYRWYKQFQRREFSLSQDSRSRQPVATVSSENIAAVKKLLETDRHTTYKQIEGLEKHFSNAFTHAMRL